MVNVNTPHKAPRSVGRRSEDRSAQQQADAQKFEAIGRLAGGIAHDFNNLTTGISGIAEELYEQLPAESPLRPDLAEIRDASDRIAHLTRQLLAFSRRQAAAIRPMDLNAVVGELAGELAKILGPRVHFAIHLGEGLQAIYADRKQIEEIFTNLVRNARDAVSGNGTVRIETAALPATELPGEIRPEARAERYAVMRVSDDGSGMDSETRGRLFEPFFTTKARGSGLGLATVHGIVKQNGGEISVESQPGRGSRFTIFWPGASKTDLRRPLSPDKTRLSPGRGTILIVEDEGIVMRVVTTRLKAAGYDVITAGDGFEALAIFERSHPPIDLLVTDVIMPGMNGRELVQAVRAKAPGLRVIFMSGYTRDVIAQQGIVEPGLHFIEKTQLVHQLLPLVQSVLTKS